MSSKLKKIYFLPNAITAFGLSCGLFVIFKMNMTPIGEVSQELLIAVSGILMLAALADFMDGLVARIIQAESEFGSIFDSLADGITFGVAPCVIVLKTLSLHNEGKLSFLLTAAGIVFCVCSILRLARYGVLNQQSKTDESIADSFKRNFTGLPTPAAAAAVVSMNQLLASNELRSMVTFGEEVQAAILIATLFLIGYFMVSRWKFPSLKSLHIKLASFHVIFLTTMASVALFYGLMYHFIFIFFGFSWLYIFIAGTLSLIRIFTGRKLNTLEDFEPEEETDSED